MTDLRSTTPPLAGLRGIEHVGITVPDVHAATAFFVDVLGAEHIYTLSGKSADDDWMQVRLGVHPRTTIREIHFLRLANGANLELIEYRCADRQAGPPRNSDIGAVHLALYVDNLDAAVAQLRDRGVDVMGDLPVHSRESAEGQRWLYFLSPWGLQFELVSFPAGKAYESRGGPLLWHPDPVDHPPYSEAEPLP